MRAGLTWQALPSPPADGSTVTILLWIVTVLALGIAGLFAAYRQLNNRYVARLERREDETTPILRELVATNKQLVERIDRLEREAEARGPTDRRPRT